MRSLLLAFLLSLFALPHAAHAQRSSNAIGGQVGDPSGVTLLLTRPGYDYEFLAAWDLDDFLFFNAHALTEYRLDNDYGLFLFYGPGLFVGFRDQPDDEVVAGLSASLGIALPVDRFQFYLRVVPRLSLVPSTDGDVDAALGVRYFL